MVVRFHDWLGASAFVSHWIVAAAPDSVTVVNHPLADNDVVQVDIMVTSEGKLESLSAFSVVSATGAVFPSTPLNGHYRLTGLKVSGGLHTFVFENAGDSRSKTVHLLVTQHKIAPGAKGP